MGALRVQQAYVVAHQLQDFSGVETLRSMAFDIDKLAQLVPGRPSRPLSDESAFHTKHDRPQKVDPLSRPEVIANPASGFTVGSKKCSKG